MGILQSLTKQNHIVMYPNMVYLNLLSCVGIIHIKFKGSAGRPLSKKHP